MISLYKSRDAWGTPDLSPFAIKLEAYLRMAGVPYQVKRADIRKSPKGKIPYVKIDDTLLGDSQLIIEHLKATQGDPLDQNLTPEQRAVGHAVRRMLEEGTYFTTVFHRWMPDDAFAEVRAVFLTFMPRVIGPFILTQVRKRVKATLQAQGTGRHSPEVIAAMGIADITALAAILGDKPYILGNTPSSIDATVWGFLVAILGFPLESPIQKHAKAQDNLVRYVERLRQQYWADWKPSAP